MKAVAVMAQNILAKTGAMSSEDFTFETSSVS